MPGKMRAAGDSCPPAAVSSPGDAPRGGPKPHGRAPTVPGAGAGMTCQWSSHLTLSHSLLHGQAWFSEQWQSPGQPRGAKTNMGDPWTSSSAVAGSCLSARPPRHRGLQPQPQSRLTAGPGPAARDVGLSHAACLPHPAMLGSGVGSRPRGSHHGLSHSVSGDTSSRPQGRVCCSMLSRLRNCRLCYWKQLLYSRESRSREGS